MTFGDRLRELREGKGLSRQALATASGVTFATIHGYEIGRRAPSFSNVVKLAAALGVECTAFADCDDVTGEESAAPPPKKPKGKPRGKGKG
jgi:transcriptional regulator with XRE-family HTH domain